MDPVRNETFHRDVQLLKKLRNHRRILRVAIGHQHRTECGSRDTVWEIEGPMRASVLMTIFGVVAAGCGTSPEIHTYESDFFARSSGGQSDGSFGARGVGPIAEGGLVEIRGPLTEDVLESEIRRNQNQIAYCYARALKGEPTLAGHVSLKFIVAADGAASGAEYASEELMDEDVRTCLVGRVGHLSFPANSSRESSRVTYSLSFRPG